MKKENEKDYEREILVRLVKKYHKRQVTYGKIQNVRRIILRASEIYKDYEKTNCDLQLKTEVNEAAGKLKKLHFIDLKNLLYSDDIEKIYLNEEQILPIESYLEEQYQISTREYLTGSIKQLIKEYRDKGDLTRYYCGKLADLIQNSVQEPDVVKESEILQMLDFLQHNERELYVREASMLVYGSSKYFEDNHYDSVCNIIRESGQKGKEEFLYGDEVLRRYLISGIEQEVCLRGDYIIEFSDYILYTKYFDGGISLSSKDIPRIKKISVQAENILTIENKTAFYRFEYRKYATIYLGGFANRHQISFLKRLYSDNPDHLYFHFGDIDVGGFLIHQHLCHATGIGFQLYCMGVKELRNEQYKNCLQQLTANDRERIKALSDNPLYKEVVAEMIKEGVKLEQEIICCNMKFGVDTIK